MLVTLVRVRATSIAVTGSAVRAAVTIFASFGRPGLVVVGSSPLAFYVLIRRHSKRVFILQVFGVAENLSTPLLLFETPQHLHGLTTIASLATTMGIIHFSP